MSDISSIREKRLDQVLSECRIRHLQRVKDAQRRSEQQMQAEMEAITRNRSILPILDAEYGDAVRVSSWYGFDAERVTVRLGKEPPKRQKRAHKEFKAKILSFRHTVGNLRMTNKEPLSKTEQTVEITLESTNYPGVTLQYVRRLTPKDKCRIVRTRHSYFNTSLVCENS